jgi:hypothetical protein
MTTQYSSLNLNQPLKFLGATVLSFNSSLGLGQSESSLTVQLIEDCEASPPDLFLPNALDNNPNKIIVGDPVYFTAGSFTFGGILSSWNVKLGNSGRIFEAKVTDPRQLLQNISVVIDSYNGTPKTAANYVNIYHHLEEQLCAQFGLSFNNEQGTPYLKIMEALITIQEERGPFICSPTCSSNGQFFAVDFSTFPGGANSPFQSFPDFYRLNGPAIPLLEILIQASDVAGFEFYVYLEQGATYPTIKIGLIDLRNAPTSFGQIQTFVDGFVGGATELSYGQELRNETTKTMLIGEKVHYMTETNSFYPFFGEEIQNGERKLVIPYGWDAFGFWINKSTETLDSTLNDPLGGVYQISEMDIRTAMASFKSWLFWVFISKANGSLNNIVRAKFPLVNIVNYNSLVACIAGDLSAINAFGHWVDSLTTKSNSAKLLPDVGNAPNKTTAETNKPQVLIELEKIHKWLSDLGTEYYGKKYLCALNDSICYYLTNYTFFDPDGDGDPVFSSNPTTSAWVDPGIPVLQLGDPYLELFRDDTGKIGGFAVFNTDGTLQGGTGSDTNGNFGIPTVGGAGGGQGVAGFCWVAREVYGENNIKWLIFREWMITSSPNIVYSLYKKYGKNIAIFIKNKPKIKKIIKYFMDNIIYKYIRSKYI